MWWLALLLPADPLPAVELVRLGPDVLGVRTAPGADVGLPEARGGACALSPVPFSELARRAHADRLELARYRLRIDAAGLDLSPGPCGEREAGRWLADRLDRATGGALSDALGEPIRPKAARLERLRGHALAYAWADLTEPSPPLAPAWAVVRGDPRSLLSALEATGLLVRSWRDRAEDPATEWASPWVRLTLLALPLTGLGIWFPRAASAGLFLLGAAVWVLPGLEGRLPPIGVGLFLPLLAAAPGLSASVMAPISALLVVCAWLGDGLSLVLLPLALGRSWPGASINAGR